MSPTKVFISYAHESEAIANDVLNLSNHLRSKGIDAEIDQYEEAPPEGWPKWMMRQVQQADFVLVICTKLFHERANDFSGGSDGLGVKWETNLILQQLYTASTNNQKYIPVIFGPEGKNHIPLPLQPYTYYDARGQDRLSALIERLSGVSKTNRPPLGEPISSDEEEVPLPPKDRKTLFFTSIIDIELWNEARWKGTAFLSDPSLEKAPIIGFVFEDNEKGEEIFSDLKERFGDTDSSEEIRLSFIKEISSARPQDYKVHIGTDWEVLSGKLKAAGLSTESSLVMSIGRIHEMNPPADSKNLEIFMHAYKYFGAYFITNFRYSDEKIVPNFENCILKKKISVRNKPDVISNKNDPDFVVFSEKT